MSTTLQVSEFKTHVLSCRGFYGGPFDKTKPVVIFVHGLGLCQDVFDGMLPAFKDFSVITYDLFGHGKSGTANGELDLETLADTLAGFVDDYDLPPLHVVGFSIGGMINRKFALDHPAYLASLVILNSPHDRGAKAQEAVEARAKSVRDQGAFSTFDDALKRWFTPDYLATGEGPRLVRKWREMVDPESYAQTAWVLAHGVRELTGRDGEIAVPTLVMTCENDSGSTPAMAYDIAAEIPGAEVQIVPGLQHLGLMENPDAFTAPILAFLKKVTT